MGMNKQSCWAQVSCPVSSSSRQPAHLPNLLTKRSRNVKPSQKAYNKLLTLKYVNYNGLSAQWEAVGYRLDDLCSIPGVQTGSGPHPASSSASCFK